MKQILNYLFENKTFTREQSKEILTEIAKGKYNNSQMAAFMTAVLLRSITVNELEGFRDAMLELCLPVDFGNRRCYRPLRYRGDGKDTFNISTLASFVVAGAGYKVCQAWQLWCFIGLRVFKCGGFLGCSLQTTMTRLNIR